VIQQIMHTLQSKSNRKMHREFFTNMLVRHMDAGEAARQLDTLIDWGRYAELFDYDPHTQSLFLE
jgi:NitT/TauT family transport system ATP-binding protein